jgi:chitin synthase
MSSLLSGLTNSGKSTTSRHFTTQILHLSAHTKAQKRLSDQITYLMTLLESFGHSKTPINPSASQFGRFLELHFSSDGEIAGAKVLPFGLNKSRLGKLQHEERSFHVFYQFLAGASPEERESLNLEDASDYQLLSRSGCYRLPGGPFSDDSTQLSELRVAFANLGFKAKHVRAIFNLLTTILLLSNLTFADNRGTGSLGMTSMDEKARVEDRQLLATIAAHLGVGPDDLESVLVNKTKWVRKDLCSMILDAPGAEEQRDSLMRDLYAILFTFVVEMANKKLCAGSAEDDETPELQIVQLDLPGYQSRTLSQEPQGSQPASTISMLGGHLVNASGQNGFDEFSVNFANELLQSYLVRQTFEDGLGSAVYTVNDGLRLPAVVTMDNAACVEMLRGGLLAGPSSRLNKSPGGVIKALSKASDTLKGGEERNEERAEHILENLHSSFGRHGSFTVSPAGPSPAHVFGINHWSGQCVYDASDFVDKNADVMDKQLVDLLRESSDSFISKLVSGPGLATEGHPLDPNITVEAQVSSIPLRTPTSIINPLIGTRPIDAPSEWPLDPSIPHPVTSQINATLSTMLNHLNCTRVWTVSCIRPNDSGHANSFDKRRVKAQVKSLLLADKINRKQVNWIADYPLDEMCARHGLDVGNSAIETVEAFVESRGWTSGVDYQIGQERIWMTWSSWREQEDLLRSGESRRGFSGDDTAAESDEDNERLGDVKHNANRGSRYGGLGAEQPDMGESEVNLLIKKADGTGDEVYTPNTINERSGGAGYLGYRDDRDHDLNGSGVWSDEVGVTDYTKEPIRPYSDTLLPDQKEGRDAFVVNEKKGHISTEVIATTPARRWWLRITWFLTWWIPSFLLVKVGKMKRADIRMAWREKVAIFMMVIGMCGTVVFYIVIFGRLLCPDNDKAWNPTELSQHAGDDDYYAAIRGKVYDVSLGYRHHLCG